MSVDTTSTYSWNEAPFSTKLDPRRFFAGTAQEEALSRIQFLVQNRRRLGLLLAPFGCGKSMLLDVAARQLRQQNRHVVLTTLMGMENDEFLWKLAAGLGANPRIDANLRQLWRQIDDLILADRYQRIATVLLFDDVDEAETSVLTSLARLAEYDANDDSRLTLLLSCDIGRSDLLGRRLQELCDLRIEMDPWDPEETRDFVRFSLAGGGCNEDLFSTAAIQRLYELTQGIPRRVQQLAQLALIAATAQDLAEVNEDTLEAVQQELSARHPC